MYILFICLRAVPITRQAVHAVIRFFVHVELTCALYPLLQVSIQPPRFVCLRKDHYRCRNDVLVLLLASRCICDPLQIFRDIVPYTVFACLLGHHPGNCAFRLPLRSRQQAPNVESAWGTARPNALRPRPKASALRALGVASCSKSVHVPTLTELAWRALRSLFCAHSSRHTSVIPHLAPWVLQNLVDVVSLLDVAVQHATNEIDALVADCVRHTQVTIHDLVDTVERVFLVDDGVEQDAESPYVLLFAIIRFAGKDFRCSVVCSCLVR